MTDYPLDLKRSCDVLMKGGITSGVIYPRAVCELARSYKLASVGGSSAGAIAAAAAAAAELGRATDGFGKLEKLPTDLMATRSDGTSVLYRLFQPQDATAALYGVFTAGLGKSGPARWVPTVRAALSGFGGWALLGALPGAVLVVLGLAGDGVAAWAAVVAGLLVLVVGVVAMVAFGLLRSVARDVPANGFGLCSGMPGASSDGADPLTPWLHDKLQELAGRSGVLTFGDLAAGGVQLRMMTTNLTRHQPMRMPWPEHEYFFDPGEFRDLFPDDVVTWMCEHPPPLPEAPAERWDSELRRLQARPKVPFPLPEHVPVIVATRMSLSFPVLIAAVPLYAVDYTRTANQAARTAAADWRHDHPGATPQHAMAAAVPAPDFEVNWFSDGGIASNLPVHFFDTPLPGRPTFAVDLAPFPPDQKKDPHDESKNTYLPTVNQGGLSRRWSRWNDTGLGAVTSFGRSIVDTARGWVDEAQLVMPGYRDRIVTIYHDGGEGGMNLNMDEDVVGHLVDRGRAGAASLVSRFVGGNGWDNHRWIRFRTATAGLDSWLAGFQHGYGFASPGGTPYADLPASPPSYKLGAGPLAAVTLRTAALLTLASQWQGPPADAFTGGSPSPRPVLRLVPGGLLEPAGPGAPPVGPVAEQEPVPQA
jgi:predicted acylesterase/phospholipase RssA